MGYLWFDILDLPYDVKRTLKHFSNKEYYQAEQQREHSLSCSDTLENFIADEKQNVEELLEKKIELAALRKALEALSNEERKLIDEIYFSDEQQTIQELAHRHGISRKSFWIKHILLLAKLRDAMEYYLNNEQEIW